MKFEPHLPNTPAEDDLPEVWLAALRALPSEHATPSEATDAAILAEARASLATIRRHRMRQRVWPALAAAACLALAFGFLSDKNNLALQPTEASTTEDPYAVILREVTSVFPHQVNAIVTDGGELQITLSDVPVADGAQAVVIEACEHGACTTVITYIGQTVEIGRQRITVHADEDGVIVLEGQQHPAPGLHIKTRRI